MNDELNAVKEKAEKKYSNKLEFIKKFDTNFNGTYQIIVGSDKKYPISGKIQFIPKEITAKYLSGIPFPFLILDVVIKDLKGSEEVLNMIEGMLQIIDDLRLETKTDFEFLKSLLPFIYEVSNEEIYFIFRTLNINLLKPAFNNITIE